MGDFFLKKYRLLYIFIYSNKFIFNLFKKEIGMETTTKLKMLVFIIVAVILLFCVYQNAQGAVGNNITADVTVSSLHWVEEPVTKKEKNCLVLVERWNLYKTVREGTDPFKMANKMKMDLDSKGIYLPHIKLNMLCIEYNRLINVEIAKHPEYKQDVKNRLAKSMAKSMSTKTINELLKDDNYVIPQDELTCLSKNIKITIEEWMNEINKKIHPFLIEYLKTLQN